jgi:ribonucleotide monophosphatase NagD (HAD superfamily)
MESRGKTLFIDIDGTILRHGKDGTGAVCMILGGAVVHKPGVLLDGVRQKFNDWHGKGYRLILTTGRCESTREQTEKQLRDHGLFWDMLIMGIGGGQRVLINDLKSDGSIAAVGVNVPRDAGFGDIDNIYANVLKQMGGEREKLPTEI